MKPFLIMILSICISSSCRDSDPFDYTRVRMNETQEITATSALLSAELIDEAGEHIGEHGFVWGTSANLNLNDGHSSFISLTGRPSSGQFSHRISTHLIPGGFYFARGYIVTDDRTIYSSKISFTTETN